MRLADTVSLSPPFAKASKRGGSPDRLQQLSGFKTCCVSNLRVRGHLAVPSQRSGVAQP